MKLLFLRRGLAIAVLVFSGALLLTGQNEVDHSYKPLIIKLNDSGSKYLRFITWHQVWAQTNNLSVEDAKLQITPMLRRSRFLALAQVSPRFLILTHIGLNNLTPSNLPALGNDGDAPQFFLHDAWTEFKVTNNDAFYIGGGLHYWNGLTRLASASTLNFMTLDQPRPFLHWHSLGITDMFGRHIGAFAKGTIGKLDYRVSVNAPGRNGLHSGESYCSDTSLLYKGFDKPTKEGKPTGNTIASGYLRYNFFDAESIKLPYNVGTYLGDKKVLAIGAGFFAHPGGMYNQLTGEHADVLHFAGDVFFEYPLPGGNMIHAYGAFMRFDYGGTYVSRWAGTGNALHGQAAFFVKELKLMHYISVQYASFESFPDPVTSIDAGLNYFIQGHNAKLTLEYHRITGDTREAPADGLMTQLRLQAHIFL